MITISFEWDEVKNTLNKRKHGISFEEAKTVFMTAMKVRGNYDERRIRYQELKSEKESVCQTPEEADYHQH
ncbi:MAG: BrnT family toxin [Lachnospiraceae bacterium]|nr:BrnT family toxin [Lachnospiraceae bacterium]